jgi:hypothetical protein
MWKVLRNPVAPRKKESVDSVGGGPIAKAGKPGSLEWNRQVRAKPEQPFPNRSPARWLFLEEKAT